ncbi:MAG: hypothetical protein ACI82G_003140, partial [Bradymonadia bacterium]
YPDCESLLCQSGACAWATDCGDFAPELPAGVYRLRHNAEPPQPIYCDRDRNGAGWALFSVSSGAPGWIGDEQCDAMSAAVTCAGHVPSGLDPSRLEVRWFALATGADVVVSGFSANGAYSFLSGARAAPGAEACLSCAGVLDADLVVRRADGSTSLPGEAHQWWRWSGWWLGSGARSGDACGGEIAVSYSSLRGHGTRVPDSNCSLWTPASSVALMWRVRPSP